MSGRPWFDVHEWLPAHEWRAHACVHQVPVVEWLIESGNEVIGVAMENVKAPQPVVAMRDAFTAEQLVARFGPASAPLSFHDNIMSCALHYVPVEHQGPVS